MINPKTIKKQVVANINRYTARYPVNSLQTEVELPVEAIAMAVNELGVVLLTAKN